MLNNLVLEINKKCEYLRIYTIVSTVINYYVFILSLKIKIGTGHSEQLYEIYPYNSGQIVLW